MDLHHTAHLADGPEALARRRPLTPVGGRPMLEAVIPVHNEERSVQDAVRRLHAHLTQNFPYRFRITVADNASTDATVKRALAVAAELDSVTVRHLDRKGRGLALHETWSSSDAQVLAYMDVDLSTDLGALLPLIAPLISGHSELAIGSRLARGAQVVRGPKRETISRCYNLLLRAALRVRFTDAQCGFKAIRADAARPLLPLVRDANWFFDTELLVLAERSGLRIHEVPVDWTDDPDSRVDIRATVAEDLRGVRRLRRALRDGALPLDGVREAVFAGAAPDPDADGRPPGSARPLRVQPAGAATAAAAGGGVR
jgi:glycosyltransferase involved in cell wall biosynthesis